MLNGESQVRIELSHVMNGESHVTVTLSNV